MRRYKSEHILYGSENYRDIYNEPKVFSPKAILLFEASMRIRDVINGSGKDFAEFKAKLLRSVADATAVANDVNSGLMKELNQKIYNKLRDFDNEIFYATLFQEIKNVLISEGAYEEAQWRKDMVQYYDPAEDVYVVDK